MVRRLKALTLRTVSQINLVPNITKTMEIIVDPGKPHVLFLHTNAGKGVNDQIPQNPHHNEWSINTSHWAIKLNISLFIPGMNMHV